MKFKILKGTELFAKLVQIYKRADACKEAADRLTTEFGASGHATSSGSSNYFGGIDALYFPEQPDKALWRSVGDKWQNFYMPKSTNKNAWEKLKALPTISRDEINDVVGYGKGIQVGKGGGMGIAIYHTVGLAKGRGYFLMEVGEGVKYKPLKDVIEITVSEYDKLRKPIEKKQ